MCLTQFFFLVPIVVPFACARIPYAAGGLICHTRDDTLSFISLDRFNVQMDITLQHMDGLLYFFFYRHRRYVLASQSARAVEA